MEPRTTAVSPLVPSRFVTTTLLYSKASPTNTGEKWTIAYDNSTGEYSYESFIKCGVQTNIYDLRGQEKATHMDTTGFQALTAPSYASAEFLLNSTDEEIERVYYPEVEKLIKDQTGASRVVFFDHTIRQPHPPEVPDTPQTRRPEYSVHVDQTPASAHKRVERHVQPPQPFKRFQLINVWRPILNTVYDSPLAVCEFSSLDVVNDLVPTTLENPPPRPHGETYSVAHNPNHRWWFWSDMTPGDVLFLKCYDSASHELQNVKASKAEVLESELRDVAGLTPHTAFLDAEGDKKCEKRRSIEVRALVFYD